MLSIHHTNTLLVMRKAWVWSASNSHIYAVTVNRQVHIEQSFVLYRILPSRSQRAILNYYREVGNP